MKKVIKIFVRTVLFICMILGLGYLGLAVYYENGFSFMTYINGVYCTGKTVEAVNYELNDAFVYDGLTVSTDKGSFLISADSIAYSYDYREPLNHYLSVQNPYLWGENLAKGKEYSLLPAICFDEELLDSIILTELEKCLPKEKIEVRLDFSEDGFVLKDNKKNLLDIDKAKEVITEALYEGKNDIDLTESDCYYDVSYSPKEKEIIAFFDSLYEYQNKDVIYVFDDEKESFSSVELAQTLSFYEAYINNSYQNTDTIIAEFTDENGNLLVNEDAVNLLLEKKLSPYNTYHNHIFTTHDGREILIKGGTYGNKISMKTEKTELLSFLQSEKKEYIRTPEYTKEALYKGKNDIGDTYIEVDIGQQKMFYYRDGELFLETDVVTGKNKATREEVCYVYAKQRNRILRGPGYESFVKYWMPVSGGIGIHDASWRSEFGGDIYIRNGSHGCINTPTDIVSQMYEVMEVGTPCILYYGLSEEK